jgi:hypothetical protein
MHRKFWSAKHVKRSLGRQRKRWGNYLKMDFCEVVAEPKLCVNTANCTLPIEFK